MTDRAREEVKKMRMTCQKCQGEWVSPENAQRLIEERDEADRRAGAAERLRAYDQDTLQKWRACNDQRKKDAGFRFNDSFDVVWEAALAALKREASWRETVSKHGFDATDKENICHLFMAQVTRHRELSNLEFAAGDIDRGRHEWNLKHAEYMEELQRRVTALLNDCPTLETEEPA
jgi:hypothetical protein